MKLDLNALRTVIRIFFAKHNLDPLNYITDESSKVAQLYCSMLQEQNGTQLAAQDRIDISIIIAGLFKAGRRLDIYAATDALERLQSHFGAVISIPSAYALDGNPIKPAAILTPNGVAQAIVGFNNGVISNNAKRGVPTSLLGNIDSTCLIFAHNTEAFATLQELIDTACQTYAPVRETERLDTYFLDHKRRRFCLPAATDDELNPVLAERLNPATIEFLHKFKNRLSSYFLHNIIDDTEIIAWCLEIQAGITTSLPEHWSRLATLFGKSSQWRSFASTLPLAEGINSIRLAAAADATVVTETIASAPATLTWAHDKHTVAANPHTHDDCSEVEADAEAGPADEAQAARPSSRLSRG